MAYAQIPSTDTDADSPLDQDLFDQLRLNDDAFHNGAGVDNAGLNTATETVSQTENAIGVFWENHALTSDSSYTFWARCKTSQITDVGLIQCQPLYKANPTAAFNSYVTRCATHITLTDATATTLYAQFRYVTASQKWPTVWFVRRKSDGFVKISNYSPETMTDILHYTIASAEETSENTGDEWESACIEIPMYPILWAHIISNENKLWNLEQVHLAIASGIIKLKDQRDPILGTDKTPMLHRPGVRILDYDVDESALMTTQKWFLPFMRDVRKKCPDYAKRLHELYERG